MTPDFDIILEPLGVPVQYTPYRGAERAYVTYQSLGQDSILYGDNRELDTTTAYVINVYSEGPDLGQLMLRTKALLETAGWIVTVDPEIYESSVDLHRYPLYARKEGAYYG